MIKLADKGGDPGAGKHRGYMMLAARILGKAYHDLLHGDPVDRLDALIFLQRDGGVYLGALGLGDHEPLEPITTGTIKKIRRPGKRVTNTF